MTTSRYAHYSQWPRDKWPWKDFSPRELASKREGMLLLDHDAMDKLQALRDKLGVPILITSGYRSPAHNKAVGGAKHSQHLLGKAFDVRMDNHDPYEFEKAARSVGFTGFGYYPRNGFMHIDTGPPRSWGKPWPRTATKLPVEPPRKPERVLEDAEAGVAAGAGGAGGLAVAIDSVPAVSGLLGNLAPTAQTIATILAGVLICYLLWRHLRK